MHTSVTYSEEFSHGFVFFRGNLQASITKCQRWLFHPCAFKPFHISAIKRTSCLFLYLGEKYTEAANACPNAAGFSRFKAFDRNGI